MAFFQRPTDYPCLLILDPQNEFETLRKRVEQTTLKSQTVARNRSGVTNVRWSWGLSVGQASQLIRGWVFLRLFPISLSTCAVKLSRSPSRCCVFWWLDSPVEPAEHPALLLRGSQH